jgi:ABC-type transporter Mla subunit MlaD
MHPRPTPCSQTIDRGLIKTTSWHASTTQPHQEEHGMAQDTPPPNPDQALQDLMQNLSELAMGRMDEAREAAPKHLGAIAGLLGIDIDDITSSPEKAASGVRDLMGQLETFVVGAASQQEELKAKRDAIQADVVERLRAHGIDLSGRLEGLSGALDRLSEPASPIAPQHLAKGLRKMADLLDGAPDASVEQDTVERLKDALEHMGRGITGESAEEEDAARATRIKAEAREDIAAKLREFGFD